MALGNRIKTKIIFTSILKVYKDKLRLLLMAGKKVLKSQDLRNVSSNCLKINLFDLFQDFKNPTKFNERLMNFFIIEKRLQVTARSLFAEIVEELCQQVLKVKSSKAGEFQINVPSRFCDFGDGQREFIKQRTQEGGGKE